MPRLSPLPACTCLVRQLTTTSAASTSKTSTNGALTAGGRRANYKTRLPPQQDPATLARDSTLDLNVVLNIPPKTRKRRTRSLPAGAATARAADEADLRSIVPLTTPVQRRPTITSLDLARDVVRAWGIDKLHDAVVVEPYAGPGGLTRAILELKNVKRVIALESAARYKGLLEVLREHIDDPQRLAIIESDPYLWESYSEAEQQGLLADVPKRPWSEVHDNLFLACQLPNNRHGETLFVQFLTTSFGQMWLHQYGRFAMGFLMSEQFVDKILAPPSTSSHHKLAVILGIIAQINRVDLGGGAKSSSSTNNKNLTLPLDEPELYFHKPARDPARIVAVKAVPRSETGVDDFDVLDYCARNMFISRAMPWAKNVAGLAHGAENLVEELQKRGLPDPNTPTNQLTNEHWVTIANVYNAWPFKPESVHDELSFDPYA